jgi:signal transduction histidine kinase
LLFYTLILALSCLVCAACGGAHYLQDRTRRANQLAALLLLGCAHWALFLALLSVETDIAAVRPLTNVAAFGWAFIPPLILHIAMEMAGGREAWLRWLRNGLYALSGATLPFLWWTDLVARPLQRVWYGWTYEMGPLITVAAVASVISVTVAVRCTLQAARELSEAERRQLRWIALACAVQVTAACFTDVVLPKLGIPCPPLGTPGLAILAAVSVWMVGHFGYSVMAPSSFAGEILRLLPDGVALLRPDGRIRTANEGLARLAARPQSQLENLPIGELLTWSFDSVELDEVDCELLTAAGGRIPVAVTSAPLRDRQGHSLGRIVVVRDLREVADLRHRLVTSARLAAVGELAAGIAHEINNPMAFVRSNLSQLEAHWKNVRAELERGDSNAALRAELGDVDELLSDSLEGVDRAVEIVRGVRNFAHPSQDQDGREPVDLHRLLEDALRLIAPQLRGRIQVERAFGQLPEVPGSPQQLRQVFVNLLLNASQAIAPSGRIRLETRIEQNRALVVVDDDGPGIPPEIIDRIFDPFFTTKPVGEGTGLGLGIAYQIVRSHGGAIRVESTPGRGARFRVELPLN